MKNNTKARKFLVILTSLMMIFAAAQGAFADGVVGHGEIYTGMSAAQAETALDEGVSFTLTHSGGEQSLTKESAVPMYRKYLKSNILGGSTAFDDYKLELTSFEYMQYFNKGRELRTPSEVKKISKDTRFTLTNIWDTEKPGGWVHVRPYIIVFEPTKAGYVSKPIYTGAEDLPYYKDSDSGEKISYLPFNTYRGTDVTELLLGVDGSWIREEGDQSGDYVEIFEDLGPEESVSFTLPWNDYPEGSIIALGVERTYGNWAEYNEDPNYVPYDYGRDETLYIAGNLLRASDITEKMSLEGEELLNTGIQPPKISFSKEYLGDAGYMVEYTLSKNSPAEDNEYYALIMYSDYYLPKKTYPEAFQAKIYPMEISAGKSARSGKLTTPGSLLSAYHTALVSFESEEERSHYLDTLGKGILESIIGFEEKEYHFDTSARSDKGFNYLKEHFGIEIK